MTSEGVTADIASLAVRVEYLRRRTMVAMLFSLAQKALKDPDMSWEQVHVHLTMDGDYKAMVIIDAPGNGEVE